MLDEDPAKRKAWTAESSALVYTKPLYMIIQLNYKQKEAKEKNKDNTAQSSIREK